MSSPWKGQRRTPASRRADWKGSESGFMGAGLGDRNRVRGRGGKGERGAR